VGYDLYVQMVGEAVAELKGEAAREPAEVKLDVPLPAHLPSDYVAKEELRLEAYRRLAAVTSQSEVDDVVAEWNDRYGPPPPPAEALVEVARLRAECVRTGVREVAVIRGTARLSPVALRASEEMRLRRLQPKAVYKHDAEQLIVPVPRRENPAVFVRDLLGQLVPESEPSVASAAP